MVIGRLYEAVELTREEKIFYAEFLRPHRLLSSCRVNGGLREDLRYVYNHQSCEPSGHVGTDLCAVAVGEPERYQRRICSKAGIEPEKAAGLGTAANMNNAALATERYEGLEVTAVATAGVGSNGGRAGDPASYAQTVEGPKSLGTPAPLAGTINFLVFINEELTSGALVVAATLVAEAKASVLQELSAGSRYSDGIATGTGTDQVCIASLLGTALRHTDANKHSKLGELIGRATRAALQQALSLQSGLTPDARRSCVAALQRFGESQAGFVGGVKGLLPEESRALFEANFLSVNHDPVTVASVLAMAHLRDQFAWRVLPETSWPEVMLAQACQLARAVSGKRIDDGLFRDGLAELALGGGNQGFLELVRRAVAYGFARKWEGRYED